jgi:uncharacterized Zn-finger protein
MAYQRRSLCRRNISICICINNNKYCTYINNISSIPENDMYLAEMAMEKNKHEKVANAAK